MLSNVAPRRRALLESAIEWTLFFCAAGSILITAGIVAVLVFETIEFFREVRISEFLFGTVWTPLFFEKRFGVENDGERYRHATRRHDNSRR